MYLEDDGKQLEGDRERTLAKIKDDLKNSCCDGPQGSLPPGPTKEHTEYTLGLSHQGTRWGALTLSPH